MTVQEFSAILSEEFERDAWGDIDPYLFKGIANEETDPDDNGEIDRDTESMREALERILERVKSTLDKE